MCSQECVGQTNVVASMAVIMTSFLSPIIEQSPPDGLPETGTECSMRAQGFAEQGTIVGEGLALAQRSLATAP